MSDFYLTLLSHSSQNEFPDNVSNHLKIRLPQPIRLEGQGWKVGLSTITLPDPKSQLPPLITGNAPLFASVWMVNTPFPSRPKVPRSADFKPNKVRPEDLETLTGVGFMKTMKAFFAKELVSQSLASGYSFKYGNKKTYVVFKWDGDDLVIDANAMHVQKVTVREGDDYFPYLYINKELALEMGWFVKINETSYGLGPNLIMEPLNDSMPLPKDVESSGLHYWIGTHDKKSITLTMICNWRFINLEVAFKNVSGTTKRSFFVYSDVGGSGVVGNQVTDLLREVNYNRESKGSHYFEPLHIQYIQVRKEVLDIIEVQVSETTGELVKFGEGNTIVTLHFKKT